ncbi:hypothetical protein HD554DRAFT_1781182 [Boletus coccyginus]|nr:hypothetical protein HD554DRAFT_1781182 [Boletus coccyginus]
MVGTWSLDQTLLWTPGTNATTGEHVDLSDLSLVDVDAVIQQFYPGELGGLAIAEVIFGTVNPSDSLYRSQQVWPRHPPFTNYFKGARMIDPGVIYPNGSLHFGHQYVLDTPVPTWSFGHGLSYTMFNYTDLQLSGSTIGTNEDFNVTVTVHNTGSMDGKEVVQVYMTVLSSPRTRS